MIGGFGFLGVLLVFGLIAFWYARNAEEGRLGDRGLLALRSTTNPDAPSARQPTPRERVRDRAR